MAVKAMQYFNVNNPAGYAVELAEHEAIAQADVDAVYLDLVHDYDDDDPPPVAGALGNDVYATRGSLWFTTGSESESTGLIRFQNNAGEVRLDISDDGDTASLSLGVLRFVRYPHAEIFPTGSSKTGSGTDWLQSWTACRLNAEGAHLWFRAAGTVDGSNGHLTVNSRNGVGFWTSGGGTIRLKPIPGDDVDVPLTIDAGGNVVTIGVLQLDGPMRFDVKPGADKGRIGGLRLREIPYSELSSSVWSVGSLAWVTGAPLQPSDHAWLAVKLDATPTWGYVDLA